MGNRPEQYRSTCQSEIQFRVLSIWGRGSSLASQVPCLGNTIVVVGKEESIFVAGDIRIYHLLIKRSGVQIPLGVLIRSLKKMRPYVSWKRQLQKWMPNCAA